MQDLRDFLINKITYRKIYRFGKSDKFLIKKGNKLSFISVFFYYCNLSYEYLIETILVSIVSL